MNIFVSGEFLGLEASAWLAFLIDLFIKGSLVLLIGLACEKLLKRSSASVRSFLWTAIIFILLLFPLATNFYFSPAEKEAEGIAEAGSAFIQILESPVEKEDFGVAEAISIESISSDQGVSNKDKTENPGGAFTLPHWSLLLATIWILGVIISVMFTLYKFAGSRRLLSATCSLDALNIEKAIAVVRRKLGIKRQVRVMLSARLDIPCIAGLFRPVLVLPIVATTWEKEKLESVIFHELAHVKRVDLLRLVILELACAVHWMNPLIWHMAAKYRLEVENACDDFVINSGIKKSSYARQLFDFISLLNSAENVPTGVMTMARKSTLESRVTNILSDEKGRKPLGKWGAVAISLLLIMTILPLTAMKFLGSSNLMAELTAPNDGAELEEILRYFPYVGYQEIYHKDFDALRKSENAKTFSRLFEPEHPLLNMVVEALPQKSRKGIASITVAKTKDTVVFYPDPTKKDARGLPFVKELSTEEGRKKFRGARISMFEQDKLTLFANIGDVIAVVRYGDNPAMFEVGMGTITTLIDGKPAYQKAEGGFYFYPADNGEMLVARKLEDLKRMLAASKGEMPGVMEMTNLNELPSYKQDLGQIWQLMNFSNNYEFERQYYTNKVSDPNVPDKLKTNYNVILTNIKRVEKLQPIVFIVNTYKVGKEIEKVTMELCGDAEAGKRRFDKSWTNTRTRPDWGFSTYMRNYGNVPASKEFHDALEKKVTRKLDKNLIIATAKIDDKLLATARKAKEGIDDWRQQQKEAKAAKKK